MEGFFASCGPPPARNELYGESSTRAHPNHRTCLTETGARHAAPRPGISLPYQGSPQPEYPGPRFRPASLSLPLRACYEAATAGQPYESLRHRCPVSPNTPSLPDIRTRRTSAEERPALRRTCSHLSKSSPDGPFIAGRPRPILPEVFQRPGSKREREKEKTPASSLPSFFPPSFSRPHDQTCPFLPAASQRRGPAARPEESFFGDGESTRGEGAVFTKNAPSPLVIPLLHGLSPTKKAGQWPAPAFTGKTKER
ncbi:hypothetical protein DESPIG_03041 [Desulfovibrio piger ATCC 29098]|uniref:Uncharacterized protein n=1 Tax=Desulfovibrio piger ATCC 29098 TaxID=411464 RepID=B6WY65_9BACT|nr:hypothetical protein DESPIG_03041 [Desulfovibrio piger ATCC 29098]